MIAEREENAYTLGVQAGLWGIRWPTEWRRSRDPRGEGHRAQRFRKFDRLKTAEDRFVVTPNNLTIDGYAILDLADGPVVCTCRAQPTTAGSSSRSATHSTTSSSTSAVTPTDARAYLITGPDLQGRVPGDMIQVSFRTNIGFVGLRIAVTGSTIWPEPSQAQEASPSDRCRTTS